MTSCFFFDRPSGKGRKARAGYKAAAPVILALEKFHNDHRHYPGNLHELVPKYLPAEALLPRGGHEVVYSPRAGPPVEGSDILAFHGFGYHVEGDEYTLSFSYTDSGMNNCWYDSKTKKWEAHGYY